MFREYTAVFRKSMIFADLTVMAVSYLLAYYLLAQRIDVIPLPLRSYILFLPMILILWGVLLVHFGMYRSFRIRPLSEVLDVLFQASMYGLIFFGGFVYLFKITYLPRYLIIYTFVIANILTAGEKIILINMFRMLRRRGVNMRNLLIIGSHERAQHFIREVGAHREMGLRIIGVVDDDPGLKGKLVEAYRVIGTFADIPEILHTHVIDEIVVIVPRNWLGKIETVIRQCELEGVRVHVAVDHFNLRLAKARQTDWFGFPLLTFTTTPDRVWDLTYKRFFDVLLVTISLPIVIPLSIICALLIKRDSPGPVFFRQIRCGLNGREFVLYKFRTMVEDAEQRLQELLPLNEIDGPAFKMTNDPRLTRAGKWLLRWSLDELPQLWNIVKGDMSFVGPRPPLPQEVVKYDNWQRRRLSMRPGLTCLWQVRPRTRTYTFDDWIRLDLEYIDGWSLLLDVKILLRTIPVIWRAQAE